jgi:hypothetical protein
MAVCSQCNGETPDGTMFCVNCGNKMPATSGAQSTQFGMPLLRPAPASERAGGPATTQFGADELSALALAAQEAGLEEPEPPMPAFSPKPVPAPGQGASQAPAARRTVMGMPLMGASAPPAAVEPEPGAPSAPPAAVGSTIEVGGASAILSMDSLVNDLLNAPPVSAPAAPPTSSVAPAAAAQPAPTPEPALAPTQTAPVAAAPSPTMPAPEAPRAGSPSVRVQRNPLPTQDTEPTGVEPPRTQTADLKVPTKSMLPVVIGVVVLAGAIAAFFVLRG